jgi:amino acid permease
VWCSYSTIAWAIPVAFGHSSPPLTGGYADYHLPDQSMAGHVFGAFNALGTVAFAYAGHNVVLEIQATIPSTKERPSKVPMWKGVVVAYIVVAICYFPVAIIGYWAYGNDVGENIITYVARPGWLVAVANLMVVVHVIGSYQIYAMPVFDMLESVLVKRFHLTPSRMLRLVTRSLYVGKRSSHTHLHICNQNHPPLCTVMNLT